MSVMGEITRDHVRSVEAYYRTACQRELTPAEAEDLRVLSQRLAERAETEQRTMQQRGYL